MSMPAVTLEEILAMFSDKSFKVRRNAVNMLGKYKTYRDDPRVMVALIKATKDSTLGVTQAAMRVLSKRGDPQGLEALPNVLKRPHSCSFERKFTRFVTSYGQAAVPYLIAAMDNPKPDARRRVLQLLTELKAPEAFDLAIRALSDPDHTVQECAIYRLSLIGDKRAFGPLLEIMQSDDFDLPASAARAIGRLLGAEAVEYLLPMLQHRAAKTREAAIHTLWKDVSDSRIPPAIAELFYDKNRDVRLSAIRFFASHPYYVAKPMLLDLLGDDDPAIRSMAVTTLRSYDVRDLEISTIFRTMLLTEPKANVRIAIIYSLCTSFTEAEISLLESLLDRHCKELGGFFRNDYDTKMLNSILQLIRGEIDKLPFSPPEEAMPIVEFA